MAESTSVRIVIDAITQAAEKALDQVGDELQGLGVDGEVAQSVLNEVGDELNNATADAGLFKQAADHARSGARDLGLALGFLEGRADEAGDEIGSAGRKAVTTSGLFAALSLSTDGLAMSLGTLSTTLTLSLIPAVVALSTTLVPLVATLGAVAMAATGLAGAFGLVVGSGFLAWGKKLSDQNKKKLKEINREIRNLQRLKEARGSLKNIGAKRLKQLKEQRKELKEKASVTGALAGQFKEVKKELVPIIADLGQKFIPLVKDAVGAIPDLVKNTIDAVGGLSEFKTALRDLGGGAMDAIPSIAAALVDLGSDALPVVRDLIGFFANEGADVFESMVQTTKDLGPTFKSFGKSIVKAAPAINKFGKEVLKRLLPALGDLIRKGAELMSKVDWDTVDSIFGEIASVAKELAPYINQLVTEFVEFAVELGPIIQDMLPTLVKVLKFTAWAIGIVVEAWNDLPLAAKKALLVAVLAVIGAMGGPLMALAAAVGIVALAWDDMSAAAKGAIDWVKGGLADAKATLASFVSAAGTFLTRDLPAYFIMGLSAAVGVVVSETNKIYNLFAGLWNDLLDGATKGLQGLTNKFVSGFNKLIAKINSAIQTANKEVPGFNMGTMSKLEKVQMDTGNLELDRRSTNQRSIAKQTAQEIALSLDLDVSGDGPLAEWLNEQASVKEKIRNRNQDRYSRRQNLGI